MIEKLIKKYEIVVSVADRCINMSTKMDSKWISA